MSTIQHGRHTFRIESTPIEVTSISRPDEHWSYTDPAGHEHFWVVNGERMSTYQPAGRYTLPFIHYVVTAEGIDEDGYEFEDGEYRCNLCDAVVEPGTKADEDRQFINGLKRCYVDDECVSREEFLRRAREAGLPIEI